MLAWKFTFGWKMKSLIEGEMGNLFIFHWVLEKIAVRHPHMYIFTAQRSELHCDCDILAHQ